MIPDIKNIAYCKRGAVTTYASYSGVPAKDHCKFDLQWIRLVT